MHILAHPLIWQLNLNDSPLIHPYPPIPFVLAPGPPTMVNG